MGSALLKDILRTAEEMGFTWSRPTGSHIHLKRRNPDAIVVMTSTPSKQYLRDKILKDLKRASDPASPFGKIIPRS
jgi:predicted RNA binding protein YcfA (HicA-like mRNA interferase family)